MRFCQKLLLNLFLFLLIVGNALAVTDFTVEVRDSAGDYTSAILAETGLDEDITVATTMVFSFDANSGTIADGASVTTDGGSTTGTCIHQSINGQILIMSIAGGTFDDNDVVTDTTNTVTLSDGGDGASNIIKIYDDGEWGNSSGGTYDVDNRMDFTGDTSNWDGTCEGAVTLTGRNILSYSDGSDYYGASYLCLDNDGEALKDDSSDGSIIHHIIFQDSAYQGYYNCTMIMYNCVFIDSIGTQAIRSRCDTASFYNITVIDAVGIGYYSGNGQNETMSNVVVCNSGGADFSITDSVNKDYLASCDDTADDYATNYWKNLTQGDEFEAGDYHLKTGSTLIGVGEDNSGTFTDDLDDETRVAWDIGADEYIAAPTRRIMVIQ